MIDQKTDDDASTLMQRITAMLAEHRLEPTPTNFALVHRYFTAADPQFNGAVETAARSGGLNGASAAAMLAQRSVELSAADLQIIVTEATARLAEMADLLSGSGRETAAFGDALATNAAELAEGASPATVVGSLMSLTGSMIDRTRNVEQQLRGAGDEIRQLRDSLAEAQEAANQDALTGLPNRRALDARLAAAADHAKKHGSACSVAICDIDHFKLFNDRYGHQIGDEVIKFVASSLAGGGGPRLFAARYGGEEFVVLCEGQDVNGAASEIERIRIAIGSRELTIAATGQKLGHLTFSAGIAAWEEEGGVSAMLKRADAALYKAKHAGRNRIVLG